ncbi:hypothetical protein LINGRAHAP2_LOCUS34533, partial [Linum grandiflorum]
ESSSSKPSFSDNLRRRRPPPSSDSSGDAHTPSLAPISSSNRHPQPFLPQKPISRLFALPVVFVPNFRRQSGWLHHLVRLSDLARPSTCIHSAPHPCQKIFNNAA